MKYVYKIAAQTIFLIHCFFFGLVLIGYLFPAIWYFYMATLCLAFASDIIFDCCLLSKWEFDLRKKWDPSVDYNYSFASFYTYKITNGRIRDSFYRWVAVIFLGFSILINLYFKFRL